MNKKTALVRFARKKAQSMIPENLIWMPWTNIDRILNVKSGQRMKDTSTLRKAGLMSDTRSSGLVRESLEFYLTFRVLTEDYDRDVAFDHLLEASKSIKSDYQKILPLIAPKIANEVKIPSVVDYQRAKNLHGEWGIGYKQFWKDIRLLKQIGVIEGVVDLDEGKPIMGYLYPDIWKYKVFRQLQTKCDRTAAFYYIFPVSEFINKITGENDNE